MMIQRTIDMWMIKKNLDKLYEDLEEFNPMNLKYWKPTTSEIIMIIIFLSVVVFGVKHV